MSESFQLKLSNKIQPVANVFRLCSNN